MRVLAIIAVLLGFILSCDSGGQQSDSQIRGMKNDSALLQVEFHLYVNRENYERTNFGEPPQLAIWLENKDSLHIKTVWVSHRAGKNDWKGKVHCPLALPYWTSRHKLEKAGFKQRNLVERLIDAVTGATPSGGEFATTAFIPENSHWDYYIEVNISGDYNTDFPYWSKEGIPDDDANGQPSIVYRGKLQTKPGFQSIPVFHGRSEQRYVIDTLICKPKGLTSALEILDSIFVVVN